MQRWEKIFSEILPRKAFDSILVATTDNELSLVCQPKLSDISVKITFPRNSLVAFEWSDDCFDGIRQGNPVQKPWPVIENESQVTYPYLEVIESSWLKARPEVALSFPGVRHFKFVSDMVVVDVLHRELPRFEKIG